MSIVRVLPYKCQNDALNSLYNGGFSARFELLGAKILILVLNSPNKSLNPLHLAGLEPNFPQTKGNLGEPKEL